ncbi:hypothetical protein KM043_015893 [Ampulex compressa]|nr:hypothetical protein KM043_015893 [Ampulex compressa]
MYAVKTTIGFCAFHKETADACPGVIRHAAAWRTDSAGGYCTAQSRDAEKSGGEPKEGRREGKTEPDEDEGRRRARSGKAAKEVAALRGRGREGEVDTARDVGARGSVDVAERCEREVESARGKRCEELRQDEGKEKG